MGTTRLSDEEKGTLSYLTYALNSQLEEDKIDAFQLMSDLDAEILLKFSAENSAIKTFCETNQDLHQVWSEELKQTACQHIPLQNAANETLSIWNHYVSDFLMTEYGQIKNSDKEASLRDNILNQACELGSYKGLVARYRKNLSKLHNPHEKNREECIHQMMNDANKLSVFYGSIGNVLAGCINANLAGLFLKNEDSAEKMRGTTFFESAVRNFLQALSLLDDENSKKLIDCLTEGKGLSAIFKEENISIDFSKPDQMKNLFVQWVGRDMYARIDKSIKQKNVTFDEPSYRPAT